MTKRLLAACTLSLLLIPATGCLTVRSPAIGFLYTDVTYGGDAEGRLGNKEGKACADSVLGILATGDASIEAAARNGGIRNVTRVDYYAKHQLVIGQFCTIVGGT